jgi:ABC-type bacteriocin/lantibiotic exporter with double-glycine peptidase domain
MYGFYYEEKEGPAEGVRLMRKEYRNAIIGGIGSGIVVTFLLYLIQVKVTWVYLIAYPIVFTIAHLIGVSLHKRREEKKDQQRELFEKQ